jgi:hypothetical protein
VTRAVNPLARLGNACRQGVPGAAPVPIPASPVNIIVDAAERNCAAGFELFAKAVILSQPPYPAGSNYQLERLMGIVFDVLAEKEDAGVDINARYGRELAALTAAGWLAQAD